MRFYGLIRNLGNVVRLRQPSLATTTKFDDAAHVRVVDSGSTEMTSPGMSSSSARETRGLRGPASNPMPCAVEEALSERFAFLLVVDVRLVSSLVQHLGDLAMDIPAVDTCPYHGEGCLLAFQDCVVHLLQPLVCPRP